MILSAKKKSIIWVFTLLLVFLPCFSQAQSDIFGKSDLSQIKALNISDSQLVAVYRRAKDAGMSEEQVYEEAAAKGMPDAEIAVLKNRLSALIKNGQQDVTDIIPPAVGRYNPNQNTIPVQKSKVDYKIFGSELFTTTSLVFEPNLRIPPPPNYMLGPDDELIISVYGYSEKKYDLKIDELGEIYIPNVGPVLVSSLTLEEATSRIKNKLASTIYKAIQSGQTKVQVTLGKIRSVRVTVIGQAKRPGTYTVSSLTTLYNILYLCGGPTDMGSYRRIEVIRGKEKRTADLYDFLVYGNQKDNILLKEGDVVRIPFYENRVKLSGNIKREGQYEMLAGETFDNLLKYAGGFMDNAYRGSVTVERVTDSLKKVIDLPYARFSSFVVDGSDSYTVRHLPDEFENRIYVTGSIERPGPYELNNGTTLKDLINKAGGLKADAYRSRALIYRYMPDKLREIQSVNLDSVLRNETVFYMQKDDSLVINSLFFFQDNKTVSVQGSVRNPVLTQWEKGITLNDVLFTAGGIKSSGDSSNVEISRRVVNGNVEEANHVESKIIKVNLSDIGAGNILLDPFDIVLIKEKPGYLVQRVVLVQGEVLSPGTYALGTSSARISDILGRAGGFKASADSNSLSIRRINKLNVTDGERSRILQRILNVNEDSLRENSNLRNELLKQYDVISVNLKEILKNPNSKDNLQLEDGDILNIARTENLIKVNGEVYFPTLITFKENRSLKYYVQQAGGFMPQARKVGSIVIQPDGKVSNVKRFLWFKLYPKVNSRSEIFVPRKSNKNKERVSVGEWSVVLSSIALIANLIIK